MDSPTKRLGARSTRTKRSSRNHIERPALAKGQRSCQNGSANSLPSTSSKSGENDSVASPGTQIEGSQTQISNSTISPENDCVTSTGSKRSSPAGDEGVSRSKRIRTAINTSPAPKSTVTSSTPLEPPETERKSKVVMPPARRSTRHATVQSTQISEGTLRPPGPPCLEAALSIALRNLESETWRYLWTYYKDHQGDPLPTPAHVKRVCPQVRRAAEAVDKADRELEDAIDEIMRSASKNKRRVRVRPLSGKQPEKIPEVDHAQVGYLPPAKGDGDHRDSSSLSGQEDEHVIDPDDVGVPIPREASSRASSRSTKSFVPLGVHHNSPRARRSQPSRTAKITTIDR